MLVSLADKHCANKEFFVGIGRKLANKKVFSSIARALSIVIALLPWK